LRRGLRFGRVIELSGSFEARAKIENPIGKSDGKINQVLERAKGIEPSYAAWEAAVLPLNYARAVTG
jgi:hypothetical protein